MALWEFPLEYDDGTVVEQTVISEGADEESSASAAESAIQGHSGVVLSRPGVLVLPDAELRWREILDDGALPIVVSNAGRLALYARGK